MELCILVGSMTRLHFFIAGRLDGLNAVTNQNRANRYAGAQAKASSTDLVAWQVKSVEPIIGCHDYTFIWHEANRRRDPDNIASAVKFVFDGLIKAGVLENDGWGQVLSISHRFAVDPQRVGVEVIVE